MLQFIGFILFVILCFVALSIAFAILKVLISWTLKLLGFLVIAVLALIGGVPAFAGFLSEKIFSLFRARFLMGIVFALATPIILFEILSNRIEINSELGFIKYIVPEAFLISLLLVHRRRISSQKLSVTISLFQKKEKDFYCWYFTSFFLALVAIAADAQSQESNLSLVVWVYWIFSVCVQLWLYFSESTIRDSINIFHTDLSTPQKLNSTEYLRDLKKKNKSNFNELEAIYCGILMLKLKSDEVEEIEIDESNWIFNKKWHAAQLNQIDSMLRQKFRHKNELVQSLATKYLNLSQIEATDYIESHLSFGDKYDFSDGTYFLHFAYAHDVNKCAACGLTEKKQGAYLNMSNEWYCSDICEETEKKCIDIKTKAPEKFLSEAATSGFIVMAGATAWRDNHKIFATGGQGHGFAAETGNTRIDKLLLRDAEVIGGDNAKNGADRIVNGQLIQTKYLGTGRRSVGAGFDGSDGQYRYVDNNGKPMQLEVPKDQYADAVKTMSEKIKEGKVPGVSDPNQAKDLVRAGQLTYEQAVNITKFGTIESLSYDFAEGAIVGLTAGGISFGITTFVYYLNTKDKNAAIRVALIQAGKTTARTTVVYVGAQQLHRLASVQSMLSYVDVKDLSPTAHRFLEKGFGVSKSGVNNALRGTIVTSVIVIAVTTGPDLVKLIRGRISQAQFLKNLAVATSGVAGGVIGSVAGGAIGTAVAGPVGAVGGRIIGGMVGCMAAAAITNGIANKMMEEDRTKMLNILQTQIEYLAKLFILTADELENLGANLDRIITQNVLEDLFAIEQKRAFANAIIKPVVVGVVIQRPAISYDLKSINDACLEIAA